MSTEFDAARPFRLWDVPSVGLGDGLRNATIQMWPFATLAEAKEAGKRGSANGGSLHITEGESQDKVVWRPSDPD